jgi:hypothetical protein
MQTSTVVRARRKLKQIIPSSLGKPKQDCDAVARIRKNRILIAGLSGRIWMIKS